MVGGFGRDVSLIMGENKSQFPQAVAAMGFTSLVLLILIWITQFPLEILVYILSSLISISILYFGFYIYKKYVS